MITALLAITLAMLLLASITDRLRVDVRRTTNLLHGQQMFLYALGGENMARLILERDAEEGLEQDTLFERWAQKAPVFPLENGGLITGRVEDLQGRFNLTNLLLAGAPNPVHVARFRRILAAIGADEGLVDAVVDWIDANEDISGDLGAENEYYLSLKTPYTAANKPFSTTRELLLVRGFDEALFRKLEPWVATLPEGVGLNLNTAPPIQLESLDEALSRSIADSLAADRNKDGYKDTGGFMKELEAYGIRSSKKMEGLTVRSQYFLAEVDVKFGDQQMRMRSYLHRTKEGVVTVSHRTQELF